MTETPSISVLVSARKNSKYLAKFLFGYFERTADNDHTEILVMLNEHDTWNRDLVDFYKDSGHRVRFFYENERLGRAGLHVYFNTLLKSAGGEWVIYFCEDHFIVMDSWDSYVRAYILRHDLDPRKVWCLIPKFDNVGAMNQILSRGYINAIGDVGKHGWIDSYINDLNGTLPGNRVLRFDHEMFHDFTHDKPTPMSDEHCKGETGRGKLLPPYKSDEVRKLIAEDSKRIHAAMEKGL